MNSNNQSNTDLSNELHKQNPENIGFVSIVCACMNRGDTLKVTLTSWLKFPEVGEIIIVDWSSAESLEWVIDLDERIKLIRVDDQCYFNISKAYNLAIDNATKDYVLKMDVDYLLNPYYNFFDLHARPRVDSYYTGNGIRAARDPIFLYLNGLIYTKRSNLIQIDGYNENFEGYGWDDTDLYEVLNSIGKKRLYINHDYSIMHIVHPEVYRSQNYEQNSIRSSARRNRRNNNNDLRRIVKWSVEAKNEQFFLAQMSPL